MAITMLDNGQLLIPLDSGLLAPVDAPRGERELTAVRREAVKSIKDEFFACAEDERDAMAIHQREFLAWCESRGTRHSEGICASLRGLAAEKGSMSAYIRQYSENDTPLQPTDLNSIPIDDSLFALSDGQVYSARYKANLNKLECFSRLRTTDAPTVRERWMPGAYIADPDQCETEGQRYAAYIIRAWGDSWPLLVYMTLQPRKANGCGVLIGAESDRGKTTLPTILQTLGLAHFSKNPKWLDGGGGGDLPRFNYMAKELCRNRLVVLDELTKKAGECKSPAPATQLKYLTGAIYLPYETKNAHPVTELRQGNLLITGNYDLLIDIDDPAIADRVFFIPPPAYEPALHRDAGGMNPAYANDKACRQAILDAYFAEVHRIGDNHRPPYTNDSDLETQDMRESHRQTYADWRAMQRQGKSKGKSGESDGE